MFLNLLFQHDEQLVLLILNTNQCVALYIGLFNCVLDWSGVAAVPVKEVEGRGTLLDTDVVFGDDKFDSEVSNGWLTIEEYDDVVELLDTSLKLTVLTRERENLQTTIHCHMKKWINDTGTGTKKRTGRPPKVTDRDGTFNSKHVRRRAEVYHLAPRTVRDVLNKAGYKFKQCWKKGILLKGDLKKRVKFAKKCKKLPANFWKEGSSSYLDGVSFVHKTIQPLWLC